MSENGPRVMFLPEPKPPRHFVPDSAGGFRAVPMLEWAAWFERTDETTPFREGGRRVAWDVVDWYDLFKGGAPLPVKTENARVSTVFLGLDHSFGFGPPLLFETMIFGGVHDGYQDRYSTLADAEAGHAEALALARETQPDSSPTAARSKWSR